MRIRVKVKPDCLGWFGLKRRRPGNIFFIERKEQFSSVWMEAVDKNGLPLVVESGDPFDPRKHDQKKVYVKRPETSGEDEPVDGALHDDELVPSGVLPERGEEEKLEQKVKPHQRKQPQGAVSSKAVSSQSEVI